MRRSASSFLVWVGSKLALAAVSVLMAAAAITAPARANIIAAWNFETSNYAGTATTSAALSADAGGVGTAVGVHAGAATVWSAPAGNGSSKSFSSNTWAVGDYYEFQVSAAAFTGLGITFDQTSSSTGPGNFKLQYSTDGSDFTDFNSYTVLANAAPNTPWSSTGSPNGAYTSTFNLSSVTALNNSASVYFRLTDTSTVSAGGGTVGTSGTDRVDNVTITGTAVPEPSTLALLAGGGLAVVLAARRRQALRDGR